MSHLGTTSLGPFTEFPKISWDKTGIIKIYLMKLRLKITSWEINKRTTRLLGRGPSWVHYHLPLGSNHLSPKHQAFLKAYCGI